MRWTEEEYAQYLKRAGAPGAANKADVSSPPFALPQNEAKNLATGRLPDQGMNKTEAAYDAHLWLLRKAGDVLWHKFEAVKLRLADATFYTPDFLVLPSSGIIEVHETKGFWREDARIKIKVAASIYPFKFVGIKKNGDGWEREEF
jgi:hypothetical protein